MRGFADCFTDSLIKQGLFDGSTVIVSPTNSKTVEKLNAQSGKYGLLVRGIKDGKEVNGYTEISCISRAVNPYADFDGFISLALLPEVRFIISNTTEAGIRFDSACKFEDAPAASFPGKLTQLLYKRFSAGLRRRCRLRLRAYRQQRGRTEKMRASLCRYVAARRSF